MVKPGDWPGTKDFTGRKGCHFTFRPLMVMNSRKDEMKPTPELSVLNEMYFISDLAALHAAALAL